MINYIKSNLGTIAVIAGVFIFGMLVGLYCNANDDGIYVSANYPNDVEIFTIGKNEINLTDMDLSQLSEADGKVIASKMQNMDMKNPLSMELREMAKKSNGPFEPIPVNVNLHFVNDNEIHGQMAKACKGTPIYGNRIIFHKVKDNVSANIYIRKYGVVGIQAMREEVADCRLSADNNSYDLWVDKEYIKKWMGSVDADNKITVEGRIVISDLSIQI